MAACPEIECAPEQAKVSVAEAVAIVSVTWDSK